MTVVPLSSTDLIDVAAFGPKLFAASLRGISLPSLLTEYAGKVIVCKVEKQFD